MDMFTSSFKPIAWREMHKGGYWSLHCNIPGREDYIIQLTEFEQSIILLQLMNMRNMLSNESIVDIEPDIQAKLRMCLRSEAIPLESLSKIVELPTQELLDIARETKNKLPLGKIQRLTNILSYL